MWYIALMTGLLNIHSCILVLVLRFRSSLNQQDTSIPANCNDDIHLPCSANTPGTRYRYMVWYRNDTAIIKRKIHEVTVYNKSSPASLGVQDTLVLQNVQPSDSGYYQCFLAADIGQKDKQSYVSLTVSECVTVSPTRHASEIECILDVVEVPVLWALLGFTLISMSKIIFCIIIVKVCKKHKGNELRHRSGRQRSVSYKHRENMHF